MNTKMVILLSTLAFNAYADDFAYKLFEKNVGLHQGINRVNGSKCVLDVQKNKYDDAYDLLLSKGDRDIKGTTKEEGTVEFKKEGWRIGGPRFVHYERGAGINSRYQWYPSREYRIYFKDSTLLKYEIIIDENINEECVFKN